MKLLTFSTLYPNAAAPSHGVFVENRLAAWLASSGDQAKVIAPIPWFPFSARIFGRYARFAAAPPAEIRRGIEVRHPRYFIPPKIGMDYAPSSLARALEKAARALLAEGSDFDLVDAHYLYPDGVAAVRAARALGKPVVITARGSDVTLLPSFPKQRSMILDALAKADAVVAVAAALKDELVRLGAPAEKITVLRNGVDLSRFRPADRDEIRARMNLEGPVVASVGGLIGRKGHDVVIRALAAMPEATLLVVGEGEEESALKSLAAAIGVADRVRFIGAVPHEALADIYNVADALALASTREGWPNVVLEAMACGTPVVAANAGGAAEAVGAPEAGRIVSKRTPEAFAEALREIVGTADRDATRRYAEQFSWEDTSEGLSALFGDVVARRAARSSVRFSPVVKLRGDKPKLLVTVDTEEIFAWDQFPPDNARVPRPGDIDRFQSLCEKFGAKPLYFLTFPLLGDAESAGYFRRLTEEGRAHLGLHLHQWNTPPFGGFTGEYYSYQCNLPAAVHQAKLRALAEAFEKAFGFRARAHRAGRYGVSKPAYREIAGAGVNFDFSPSPAFDFSGRGGPDFSRASNHPFTALTDCGGVFVTPTSGERAVRGGRVFLNQPDEPGLGEAQRSIARSWTAPLRLSPEGARFSELAALTNSLAAAKVPVITFSMHSTTMTPGGNPYAPDAGAVDASLELIRRYLQFFTKDFGGGFIDFDELDARAAKGD